MMTSIASSSMCGVVVGRDGWDNRERLHCERKCENIGLRTLSIAPQHDVIFFRDVNHFNPSCSHSRFYDQNATQTRNGCSMPPQSERTSRQDRLVNVCVCAAKRALASRRERCRMNRVIVRYQRVCVCVFLIVNCKCMCVCAIVSFQPPRVRACERFECGSSERVAVCVENIPIRIAETFSNILSFD